MGNCGEKTLPLTGHLRELKNRLLIVLLSIIILMCIAFFFSKHIFFLLQKPLAGALTDGSSFVTLSPIEGWVAYFKISLFTAVTASSPVWMYQIWAFISPALYKKEKIKILTAGIFSAVLFCTGILICYFFVLPYGFEYFVSILNETGINLMPQMSVYLSFILRLFLAFGIVFELPVFVLLLVKYGIVSEKTLREKRRYVIVAAFILAAILTPPDVFTQIVMAVPMILLYEASILAARLVKK